jgi:hypothetical protein
MRLWFNNANHGIWHSRIGLPPSEIFQERQAIFTSRQYVLYGILVGKGDIVWRNTEDGAVLAMQPLNILDKSAP